MILEPFDIKKHDAKRVAQLIYDSDEAFNALVLGERDFAINLIQKMKEFEVNYFTSAYLQCTVLDNEVVGVLSGYPLKERKSVDKASGKAFMKLFGLMKFIKKMFLFIQMSKITQGEMDEDGYYIVHLCVSETHRGQGIGRMIINEYAKQFPKLYLHVNIEKGDAISFYETVGFKKKFHAKVKIKNKEYGTYLMVKDS